MNQELLINFVPTGMVPRQSNHPNVPEQPNEIIDEVLEAHAKGITIAHLHARDSKGNPTHCPDVYAKIVEGIRKGAPDLIICLSLSGRGGIGLEQRAAPIYLKGPHRPDMGSLTLSSLNFTTQASVNSPETIVALAEKMNQLGVIPELEAFDLGMVNYANYLLRKGILSGPIYINLILGNIAGAQCNLSHIAALLQDLPDNCFWSLGGIGKAQIPAVATAIAMGGGVRVGLEDNLMLQGRQTSNQELLNTVHELAEIHGRKIMKPKSARKLLGMWEHDTDTICYYGRRQGRAVA